MGRSPGDRLLYQLIILPATLSAAFHEYLAQFPSPPPEVIRQAESQMLEIFKHGLGRKDEREQ
jgi:hypothetical protein